MRWAGFALGLLACSRGPSATAPRDAGPPDAGVVEAALPPPSLPPVPWHLAWIAEDHGVPQVVLDGEPRSHGPAAHYLSAVSPEGLYATRSLAEREQIVLLRGDGGVTAFGAPSPRARNVTAVRGVVLFESGQTGFSNLRTDTEREVVTDEAGNFEPELAPDATWFAFVASRDGDAELYRAAIDGGALQRLTAFRLDDVAPRISPDAKWICFVSNREGADRLFVVRADGRQVRRLRQDDPTGRVVDAGQGEPAEAEAVWTPDSKAVIFSARKGPGSPWHLFRVELASGRTTQLTFGEHDDQAPAVSPDGRWTAFVSNRDGDTELYVLEPDGGQARVTTRPGADWKPLWVP